ncbi:response regulator transcription factor [bacterium]|nr:response regulator transcription factor [bacterium]
MPTILIIEDESSILLGLEDAMVQDGYEVLTARNGEQGLKFALQEKVDLIILDIMLPRLNGFEVLRQIRQKDKRLPVILLTAKGQEKDKISGFNLGADDYVTKPFSINELLVRIKALFKRAQPSSNGIETYTLNNISFDFKAMKAKHRGKEVFFSVRELELLRFLIGYSNEVVSRAQILEKIWCYDVENSPSTRTIDNYIVKLRQKIEPNPEKPRHILTVHRKGYRFEP